MPQYVVEAGNDEDFLGADDVVLQHEGQDGAEEADPRDKHYEGRQDTADVRRGANLLDLVSAYKSNDFMS